MSRRRATDEERELFKATVEEARPMKLAVVEKARRAPAPAQKKVEAPKGGLDGRTAERLRRGDLDPDARVDLHGYTQDVAHRALLSFLRGAHRGGAKLVLVVTGKGAPESAADEPFDMERNLNARGILKSMVPRWLKEPQFAGLIAGTRAAHRRHGGAGALYIYLRKSRK